jgi:hypothetical protein
LYFDSPNFLENQLGLLIRESASELALVVREFSLFDKSANLLESMAAVFFELFVVHWSPSCDLVWLRFQASRNWNWNSSTFCMISRMSWIIAWTCGARSF